MKIFISSLITGMEPTRAAAREAVETLRHEPIMAGSRLYQNPDSNMQEIVKFLLRSGASATGKNLRGDRIMSLALAWGDKKLIQMLKQAGTK